MADFKRKKGENFESFLRRFNKSLKQSQKLTEARSKQHTEDKVNKHKQKKKALIGMKLKAKREYLEKTGKLPERRRKF